MGLLRAGIGAASSVLADSWRDYFYCDSLAANVLMTKGTRRQKSKRRSNKDDENIISNGSIIAVNPGQCMLLVQQGEIIEVCAEPGEFVFDSGTEPSIFYGSLDQGIKDTFEQIGRRFTFAGETANDQRIYYFNIREFDDQFETTTPLDFRFVDLNIDLDTHVPLHCKGLYSYRMSNPLLFYKNVAGDAPGDFTLDRIDSRLRTELLATLQPAFEEVNSLGIRHIALSYHFKEIAADIRERLNSEWAEALGFRLERVRIGSTEMLPEDEAYIRALERRAVLRDPNIRAAVKADDTMAERIREATDPDAAVHYIAQGGRLWSCPSCGTRNKGKFCTECGKPRPKDWRCPACGTFNSGKYCTECGRPRLAGWVCPACGTDNKGRFCMECGMPRP